MVTLGTWVAGVAKVVDIVMSNTRVSRVASDTTTKARMVGVATGVGPPGCTIAMVLVVITGAR